MKNSSIKSMLIEYLEKEGIKNPKFESVDIDNARNLVIINFDIEPRRREIHLMNIASFVWSKASNKNFIAAEGDFQ